MYRNEAAPERFCINDDKTRSESLEFMKRVIKALHIDGVALNIDLSKVQFASAGASVLLFAVLNRAYFVLQGSMRIRISLPRREDNPGGYRCIVTTGLAKALLANNLEKLDALVS